jgi:hypothetical protein
MGSKMRKEFFPNLKVCFFRKMRMSVLGKYGKSHFTKEVDIFTTDLKNKEAKYISFSHALSLSLSLYIYIYIYIPVGLVIH